MARPKKDGLYDPRRKPPRADGYRNLLDAWLRKPPSPDDILRELDAGYREEFHSIISAAYVAHYRGEGLNQSDVWDARVARISKRLRWWPRPERFGLQWWRNFLWPVYTDQRAGLFGMHYNISTVQWIDRDLPEAPAYLWMNQGKLTPVHRLPWGPPASPQKMTEYMISIPKNWEEIKPHQVVVSECHYKGWRNRGKFYRMKVKGRHAIFTSNKSLKSFTHHVNLGMTPKYFTSGDGLMLASVSPLGTSVMYSLARPKENVPLSGPAGNDERFIKG